MKKRYDLAFPLGYVCSSSETLRRAKLQYLSFPGDWITPLGKYREVMTGPHLRVRVDWLCHGLDGFINPEDMEYSRKNPLNDKDIYVNKRTNYTFNHDIRTGFDVATEIKLTAAKYQKRYNRLIEIISQSKRVLVLRLDLPNGKDPTTIDDCRYAHAKLCERFPGVQFDLLLMQPDPGRKIGERITEQIEPWLKRIAFDYQDHAPGKESHIVDIALTGDFLHTLYRVRDYRTRAEKRKRHNDRLAKRFAEYGATNNWQYIMAKASAFFHGRYNPIANLTARLRRKRFEQIVILGFNCEPAFRFVCKWDFLDSSLLAWTNSRNITFLAEALKNFDNIGTGPMTFHTASRMWLDENSRIYFHGKMRATPGSPDPTQAEMDSDLADLRSRIAHLKEKMLTYARNEKSTLFVYKPKPEDAAASDFGAKLDAIEEGIMKLGARNWQLLVICERHLLKNMPSGEHRVFRAVTKFNPGNDVTSRRKGDPAGWDRIFSEFAPVHVLKRAHKFKFE